MSTTIKQLEDRLFTVRRQASEIQTHIDALQASRLRVVSEEGVQSKLFKDLSHQIEEQNLRLIDLQMMDPAIEQNLGQTKRILQIKQRVEEGRSKEDPAA